MTSMNTMFLIFRIKRKQKKEKKKKKKSDIFSKGHIQMYQIYFCQKLLKYLNDFKIKVYD